MTAWRACGAAALLLVLILGCAGVETPKPMEAPPEARVLKDHILYSPTSWSGDVRLVRPVIVTRVASLTVKPGTRIFFDIPQPAPGEDREPWILVMGSLVALGTPEQPILFTSLEPRTNESDDVIQLQEAKEVHFRHCIFERGPWALHIHKTSVDVLNCVFRDNYGGVRFQGGNVLVRGSLFENNRIGVRCLDASPVIEENTFVGNLTGIFFRQGVTGAVIRRNNFDNREYDVKLGETQTSEIDASGNWWQASQEGILSQRIYDAEDGEGLGHVEIGSPLGAPWVSSPEEQ